MLWVLKRTVSMRRFFWAPKTYVETDGLGNIYNFRLKHFAYLNLWCHQHHLCCVTCYSSIEQPFSELPELGLSEWGA